MKTYGIIPARFDSSRLPGKMLLNETGKPLIQYAWEAACRAEQLDEVIIATDSEKIAASAKTFGAHVEMTGSHPTGTDRIAEVVRRSCQDAEIIVNLQGDEPELEPDSIDKLVQSLRGRIDVEMATLATPIREYPVLIDRACVKVVCAADGKALYFSRLPIPFLRDGEPRDILQATGKQERRNLAESTGIAMQASQMRDTPWLLHLGIYAYRRDFLLALTDMPMSRLERLECLEQLRALEAGAAILVSVVSERTVGIDTAEDYARFVARQKNRGLDQE